MTQSTEHRVSWQGPWSGAWGNQLQAEPSIGWLHKELIERAAFGVGLRRFLVVIALLNSAKTRTCAQEHSCMFRGQLLTVNFYLLYFHWQRLKCFLAATWFNLVVCYVEQNTLLRRSLELSFLRHLYIFILCNTKNGKNVNLPAMFVSTNMYFLSWLTLIRAKGEICDYFNVFTFITTAGFLKSRL